MNSEVRELETKSEQQQKGHKLFSPVIILLDEWNEDFVRFETGPKTRLILVPVPNSIQIRQYLLTV